MIYLDNAATTLVKPPAVAKAVYEAISTIGNSGRGLHPAAMDANTTVYEARQLVSKLFNLGAPQQVAFTLNATEALNTAIYGLLRGSRHIVTTQLEHNSVLRPLYRLQAEGTRLTILNANQRGSISYEQLEAAITPETAAVVCTHASNLTGNVIDISKVGQICHSHNILFILDASQSAGILPIDMQKCFISALCFTGHKSLYGPQGTGGLCLSPGLDIEPLKVGGSGIKTFEKTAPAYMPEHLEAGTLNSHGIAGLKEGLSFVLKTGVSSMHSKEMQLYKAFYSLLKPVKQLKFYGGCDEAVKTPVLCLNIEDYPSGAVSDQLFTRFGIATRSGGHCAPLMHEALGTVQQGAVRFSLGYFNTMEEIEKAAFAVKTLAEE